MIDRSDKWDTAIAQSHTEFFRADLWALGQKQRELEVIGGSLTVDGTADHLRRCDVKLAGNTKLNIPGYTHQDGDYLWPTGSEIRLFAGIVYPGGATEVLPQGVFRTSKPKTSESNDGDIITTCEGYDRSAQISRNRWIQPFTIPNNTNLASAIQTIISNRLPNQILNFDKFEPTSYLVPETTLEHGGESDPWKDCMDLATTAGMEVYFDVVGDPVLRSIQEDNVVPSAIYSEDKDCTILDIDRDLDEERGYSGVIVSGQHTDNHPVLAAVWDTDASSSTFVDNFGYVPYFVNTQFIKDVGGNANVAQAMDIAYKTLLQVRGIIEQISFNALANFAHEQNDLVAVKRSTINVNDLFILDSFTRGFEEGSPMSMVTRKRRTVS